MLLALLRRLALWVVQEALSKGQHAPFSLGCVRFEGQEWELLLDLTSPCHRERP
jgi:hypothetical protein